MSKKVFFLETKKDLIKLFNFIESSFKIKYIRAGLLDELPDTKNSLLDKSDLGFVNHKDWNFNERYLILNQNEKLQIRRVPQRKGGIKYAIDQLENINSLVISLGGYNISEDAIIASAISTNYNTQSSSNFFKQLNKFIKTNHMKVDEFYIGNDALDMANKGTRLTEDARMSKDYDISV
ncbi:hypothetical protein [Winogradskyella flava]|uniref:Uncharacterized protein n=1 Tax=Winogradskyella flava TaxID=1884876 RepID=A0A842IT78_9FLAO|nr:hypothetical protein [Winogradskyella flava]MBC2844627.1 hypothetical protein [Winogradskyella flava]